MRTLASVTIALLLALPAGAVLLDTPTGSENTSAPPDDPGFDHVGVTAQGHTAVYLGNGWVITADHNGAVAVTFGGQSHAWVPGSTVSILNGDGTLTDVRVYRVEPKPPLPLLEIRATSPPAGAPLVLIGNGRNRGAATSWNPTECASHDGYAWAPGRTLRWGRNTLDGFATVEIDVRKTDYFFSAFDDTGGDPFPEAIAARGDSGGGVFVKDEGSGVWELAGIMSLTSDHSCDEVPQPDEVSLFGNATYAADLAVYRDSILDVTRECRNGQDDDGDGATDWPADSGCGDADDPTEGPSPGAPVPASSASAPLPLFGALLSIGIAALAAPSARRPR